jgi:hypothetical protein
MDNNKVSFNLVFNSSNTSTYSGTTENPTFYTSLNTLVPKDKYNKYYKVSFRMKTAANALIIDQENYRLEMILNARIYNQQNNANDYTLGVLTKMLENYTTNYLSIDTKPFDNPPVIINSLDRIDRITFRIIEESTQTLFTDMPEYVLIVHFEEI